MCRSDVEVAPLYELYRRVMDGWNQGSAEAFAAAWAEEGHLVAFDGSHFEGREEITRVHGQLFSKWLKGTRLVGRVTRVTPRGADLALLHARGSTVMPGKTRPTPERDSIQTIVAVRRDGEWQILALQNTRVRPIGRTHIGTLLWLVGDALWKLLAAPAERRGRT
jgi:uncharacterized protein (TIGR02246 family)